MEFNLNAASFAEETNFKPLDQNAVYDVLIIGGGPAGFTAAVYCMRKGVKTGVIVKKVGGQVAETSWVENYMGYRFINGTDLVEKFKEQVFQFGIDYDEGGTVSKIENGKLKKVVLEDGRTFQARALIIATGKESRKLNVPGEEEFKGKGVAYCSTCDAPLFNGKKVVVVGGGNSGLEAAIDLAGVAEHVTIVQFLEDFTGDTVLRDKLASFTNADVFFEHEVVEIQGEDAMERVVIKDRNTGESRSIEAQGIFVEIGLLPNSAMVEDCIALNEMKEIAVDCSCKTSIEGIFAAGDVTTVPFKQIIVAAGEGAKAALSACNYVIQNRR